MDRNLTEMIFSGFMLQITGQIVLVIHYSNTIEIG